MSNSWRLLDTRQLSIIWTIGWTDYAQLTAGDIVFLELKETGEHVGANDEFGSIETGKWVGKLYSPIEGEIVEVNDKAKTETELVNNSPFQDGWLIKMKQREDVEPSLLSPQDYKELIKSEGGL